MGSISDIDLQNGQLLSNGRYRIERELNRGGTAAVYAAQDLQTPGQQYVALGGSGVSYLGSLTQHVFESIAFHGHFALHVRVLAGREPHHLVETQFKAFARAFRDAVAIEAIGAGSR